MSSYDGVFVVVFVHGADGARDHRACFPRGALTVLAVPEAQRALNQRAREADVEMRVKASVLHMAQRSGRPEVIASAQAEMLAAARVYGEALEALMVGLVGGASS